MVKETLKIYLTSIVIMGAVGLNAEEKVVLPPSWTTTRTTYDITVEELAKMYYGDSTQS